MHGTGAGCDQQRATVIFLQESVSAARRVVADRVRTESRGLHEFVGRCGDLAQQRIIRIAGAHPFGERSRHPQGKARRIKRDRPQRVGGQTKVREQGFQARERTGQLMLPVRRLPREVASRYHARPFPPT